MCSALRSLGSDPSRKGSDSLVVASYHGMQTSEGFFKGRSRKVGNIKALHSSTDARSINDRWSIAHAPRGMLGVGRFARVSLE